MDLRLKGKIALVTGASKGIGFACAESLAAEGCAIHLAARDSGSLDAAADKLARFGVAVTVHPTDLAAREAPAQLADKTGPVDILVNNAGAIPHGRLIDVDDDTWRAAWDLKVFGYIAMTRAVYARMRARGSGVIINIIGLSGERHRPTYIVGTAGNAALMAFTRALGTESVDHGVRVVGINPGPVETDRQIEHLQQEAETLLGSRERWLERRARKVEGLPFNRSARPDEVGDLVAFVASDRAAYLSATVITLDAGQSMRMQTK